MCQYICEKGHIALYHPSRVTDQSKCKICHGGAKYSNIEKYQSFIYRATNIHNDKYDYSLINEYIPKGNPKLPIICPIHGRFEQSYNDHVLGKGCAKCKTQKTIDRTTISEKEFKDKLHKLKPYIRCTNYKALTKQAKFYCTIHNEYFEAIAGNQLNNKVSSCPICKKELRAKASKGFYNVTAIKENRLNHSGYLYLIKIDNKFCKLGITKDIKTRMRQIKNTGKFSTITGIFINLSMLKYGVGTEILVKHKFKNYRYFPNESFQGAYECFKLKIFESIKNFICARFYGSDIKQI